MLDNLQAVVDLAAQLGLGKVVADERGPHGAAEFFERLVGRVLGAAAGEAAKDLFGFGGAEPERGGVLDELVVLLGDQLPADRPCRDLLQARVGRAIGGPVQAGRADVLQPRQQPEAEQVTEREADDAGAVSVGVVGLDLGVAAAAQQPFDHRGDL